MMSCIYMLILAGVALNFTCLAAYFCLHLLLYFAGTLFFWVGVACPFAIPYSYLHCTNMLGQRCEIGSVLRIPFTLGLVTCHPTGCSLNQLTLLLLTFCPLHSTLYCCRLIFLIYRFGTGLFNMRIYVSS